MSKHDQGHEPLGMAGKIARSFINSKLTPLIIITSILMGVGAVLLLPREEEPQIKVPMIDVMVSMPGFSAKDTLGQKKSGRFIRCHFCTFEITGSAAI